MNADTASPLCDAAPWPVVASDDVLAALDPARRPTRGWLRHARNEGWVTAGVACKRRSDHGQLAGTTVLHSALAAWSARLHREGQDEEARELAERAKLVEKRFSADLVLWLTTHDLDELSTAPFFEELSRATRDALADVPATRSMVMAAAELVRLEDGGLVALEGHSPEGHPVSIHLPWRLFTDRHLQLGDCVLVLQRLHGRSVQLEVDLAVAVANGPDAPTRWLLLGVKAARHHSDSTANEREGVAGAASETDMVGDDGLTLFERRTEARRHAGALQKMLTPELAKKLAARLEAGELPRRTLRPLG